MTILQAMRSSAPHFLRIRDNRYKNLLGEEAVQHGLVRFTHNHRLSLQSRNQRLAQRASSWEDTIRCWESRIIIRKNEVGVLFLVVEVSECLCEFAVVDVDIESTDDCADRWVLLDRAEISVSHNNARILLFVKDYAR